MVIEDRRRVYYEERIIFEHAAHHLSLGRMYRAVSRIDVFNPFKADRASY
jgi:hypothetical protein